MDDLIILEPIYSGSTFYGEEIAVLEVIDTVETPVDLTGADVLMQMRNLLGQVVHTYSTSDDTLQVIDNKIIIPEHEVNFVQGQYVFDFNILLTSGESITGFGRGSWEVLKPRTVRV